MKITQESTRVLNNLYEKLINDENAFAPCVTVYMADFARELNITDKQLNLCLWYLKDAGYINVNSPEYNRDERASKQVFLLPLAIKMIENN